MSKPATETLSVVVEREVPFPPEKIWRAITQPNLMEEWLMKNDFKPIVGHRFNLRADWGVVDCQVLAVEPNKTLAYSWVPMVSRASSLGLSPLRARGLTCAWSSRASGRISSRPTRAPRADGSSSFRPWSRYWRGPIEVCERLTRASRAPQQHRAPTAAGSVAGTRQRLAGLRATARSARTRAPAG